MSAVEFSQREVFDKQGGEIGSDGLGKGDSEGKWGGWAILP
jgi:hypothetical protein